MRASFAAALLLLLLSPAAEGEFRAEAIKAHMTFLASDLLEGRGTGTRGHQIAAEYVAAQYELAGLEPGANGEWFQEVPFLRTVAQESSTVVVTKRGMKPVTLRIFDGFNSSGDPRNADKVVDGDVVFAGFGVTAPDQRYDDYARLDVRGKIVAIVSGAPKSFPNAVRAHHSSSLNKIENAARRGAVGLMYLTTPADLERTSWERSVRHSKLGAMHWTAADDEPHAVDRQLSSSVTLSLESTRMLLGTDADVLFRQVAEGRPRSKALRSRARIHLVSDHSRLTSPNVVGLLRGSDARLRDEYLVYSAHLDHVGITEPVDGDTINNGAFDNASGIAVMLEIAREMAALSERPRRSVLFLATTAEEKGLRGADYFVNNPPVAMESIVANLNIDMPLMTHRSRDLTAFGAETSDLGDLARTVAGEMGIELSPDRFPEEVVFVRSDQYPFVRKGIPALYVTSGSSAVDPGVDLESSIKEWMRTRYHTPRDDLQQPIDWSATLPLAELELRLGLAVANGERRPEWKPDDFFGRTFGRR
jgi:hypothetical protein